MKIKTNNQNIKNDKLINDNYKDEELINNSDKFNYNKFDYFRGSDYINRRE